MINVTVRITSLRDDPLSWLFKTQDVSAFRELIQRGANLWPDAPPEIKAFADWVTTGKIMQDYHAQAGTQDMNKLARAELKPWAAFDAIELDALDKIAREAAAVNFIRPPAPEQHPITHAEMVARTKKDPCVVLDDLTPDKVDLLHMTIGISGEAGELLDAVKKHCIYNKPLDLVNVMEELGDLEYYMEGLRQVLGIRRDDILAANIKKLGKRYNDFKYSDAQAISRNDKVSDPVAAFKAEHMNRE
jgi:NTP pyrophosphatase (non-canonical NTP hydrolase)